MDALSRLALRWQPLPLVSGLILDCFCHSLSATDGLPPHSQARIIDLISRQLLKVRPNACLWVTVDGPGDWFRLEVDRLIKRIIPTVVLSPDQEIERIGDFTPMARSEQRQVSFPNITQPFNIADADLTPSALRVLRILARLKTAHTREITSLVGLSETYVRHQLKKLQSGKFIEWKRIGKYDGWEIRDKGLHLVHRSWNFPKGARFAAYRQEYRYAAARHRRTARLWRAWLEKSYSNIEIWESWTEVPVQKGIPDALAWGTHGGYECLFWLEVDGGHSSRERLRSIYDRRFAIMKRHSREWGIPIIFCVLGRSWAVREICSAFPAVPKNIAVIGQDWRMFGNLPVYDFGYVRHHLDVVSYANKLRSGRGLPFDPRKYPGQKKRTPKPFNLSSIKPSFSLLPKFDGDDWLPVWVDLDQ